jgi:hypothetical protein
MDSRQPKVSNFHPCRRDAVVDRHSGDRHGGRERPKVDARCLATISGPSIANVPTITASIAELVVAARQSATPPSKAEDHAAAGKISIPVSRLARTSQCTGDHSAPRPHRPGHHADPAAAGSNATLDIRAAWRSSSSYGLRGGQTNPINPKNPQPPKRARQRVEQTSMPVTVTIVPNGSAVGGDPPTPGFGGKDIISVASQFESASSSNRGIMP